MQNPLHSSRSPINPIPKLNVLYPLPFCVKNDENPNSFAMQKETCNFEISCRGHVIKAKLILPVSEEGMLQMDATLIGDLFILHAGFLPEGGDEIDIDLLEKDEREETSTDCNFSMPILWN
jgi:hypothetical protein